MLKKTITFEDYNGTKRTEDHYFNLSKPELIELQVSTEGGLENSLDKIMKNKSAKDIMSTFKKFILDSYGKKSEDGLRFEKTPEIRLAFEQSPAYEALYMQLVTDSDEAAKFFNGIIPAGLAEEVAKMSEPTNLTVVE